MVSPSPAQEEAGEDKLQPAHKKKKKAANYTKGRGGRKPGYAQRPTRISFTSNTKKKKREQRPLHPRTGKGKGKRAMYRTRNRLAPLIRVEEKKKPIAGNRRHYFVPKKKEGLSTLREKNAPIRISRRGEELLLLEKKKGGKTHPRIKHSISRGGEGVAPLQSRRKEGKKEGEKFLAKKTSKEKKKWGRKRTPNFSRSSKDKQLQKKRSSYLIRR